MEIVGTEATDGVHTIDMWFSPRQLRWIVERRDVDGAAVGSTFRASTEDEAIHCLEEWLRAHDETHLVGRETRASARADQQASARTSGSASTTVVA